MIFTQSTVLWQLPIVTFEWRDLEDKWRHALAQLQGQHLPWSNRVKPPLQCNPSEMVKFDVKSSLILLHEKSFQVMKARLQELQILLLAIREGYAQKVRISPIHRFYGDSSNSFVASFSLNPAIRVPPRHPIKDNCAQRGFMKLTIRTFNGHKDNLFWKSHGSDKDCKERMQASIETLSHITPS